MTIEEAFVRLSRSPFRSRFHLSEKERTYAQAKGREVIYSHAVDFVRDRLAPACPVNDGHQTPMRGHPVFVAQHACACCCRGCLHKWYGIPEGVPLTEVQQEGILNLLMARIRRQL